MASHMAESSSGTPLRNHENLSKICEEMKSWIFHSPHTTNIIMSSGSPPSEATAAQIAAGKNRPEPPDQNRVSAGKHDSPNPGVKDPTNSETCLSELHEDSEVKYTENGPASDEVGIEVTSMAHADPNASQISATLEPDGQSGKSIPASFSAAGSTSSAPLERCMSRPLHVMQEAVPCPLGLETRAGLTNTSWSISSICPSDHATNTSSPCLPQKADSESSNAAIQDAVCENGEGDVVHHHRDPVEAWLVKYMTSPPLMISHEELGNLANSRCDIDPEKGTFLPPILEPETVRWTTGGSCEDYHDILWRQFNMTTELHIKKELRSRENIARSLQTAINHEANRFDATSESGQAWPNAKCTVRPATQLDFPAVAEIVNEENKRTTRSEADKSLVMTAEEVARVWDECRVDRRPFVVVTPAVEDFLDRSRWPRDSERIYEEFARYMAEHPRPAVPVAGFAFITPSQLGMNDRPCPGTRYIGRLNLMVHPDHRHKLYGSALLDRILMSISPFHTSLVDHDWKPNRKDVDGIYEFPASRNIRQYAHLQIQVIESHNKDETEESRTRFLKKFDFEEVGRLRDGLVTEDDQRHMHWQDLVTWARIITPTSKIIRGC